jgi:predicted Zn-dependent protease
VKLISGVVFAACLFAQDKGTALGEHVAAALRQDTTPADTESAAYVRRVALRVAPAGLQVEIELRIGAIGGSPVEPVWVPGHVFVPARLLILAKSEAELAGALAHAMAYSTERGNGPIPVVGGNKLDPATNMRADRRAIAQMAAVGYDPRALLDFLGRKAPLGRERVAAMEEALAAIPPSAAWIENTSDFIRAQERARLALLPKPPARPSLFRNDR